MFIPQLVKAWIPYIIHIEQHASYPEKDLQQLTVLAVQEKFLTSDEIKIFRLLRIYQPVHILINT